MKEIAQDKKKMGKVAIVSVLFFSCYSERAERLRHYYREKGFKHHPQPGCNRNLAFL